MGSRPFLLGLRCFWSIFRTGNLSLALRQELGLVRVTTEPGPREEYEDMPASEERVHGALQVLRVMQAESGLIDFLTDDLRFYSDQQVAQGVRGMQPQAREALLRVVRLAPVVDKAEGEVHDLPQEPMRCLANGSLKLQGRPSDFDTIDGGILRHRGWRAADVNLQSPPRAQDPQVLHPAVYEIE
jgi:hypothetical protein